MESLLTADNIAIVVLVAWIIDLKRINIALEKRLEKQWDIIAKVASVLRKIKYELNIDQTGEFNINDFPKD